jgi:surfeit locus 1 family protein
LSVKNGHTERISFKWTLNWKICLFSAMLMPLLIGLGFWQLARAEQKRTLQDLVATQQDKPPVEWGADTAVNNENFRYRQVSMQGHFETQKVWLLENQIWQGKLGYQVVAPFHLPSGEAVLVNLGWIASTGYRSDLPQIPPLANFKRVTGKLVLPSQNRLLKQQDLVDTWPQQTLQIDIAQFQQKLGVPLLKWVLHIDPDHPAALAVKWQDIQMPASKHLGYAWQWFAMAFALMVLTVFANSNLAQVLNRNKNLPSV